MEVPPYYVERRETSPVRLRRQRPDDVEGWVEYGLDSSGRCVLVREYAYGRPYRDHVRISGDGKDEALDFEYLQDWERKPGEEEYRLAAVEEHRRDSEGVLRRWARIVSGERLGYTRPRLWWEEYRYRDDGALSEVIEHRPIYDEQDAFGKLGVGDVAVLRDEFVYDDDDGELALIRRFTSAGEAEPWVVWRRRPASLRPLLRHVEDRLVEYTVQWAREHWPDEPAYCLGLLYHAPYLSLDAAIGTQTHLRNALADPGEFGIGLELWNPAEFGIEHAFAPGRDDPVYVDAAAMLEQEWRTTDDDAACFKLLARVTKRLNADGRLDRARTEDFVVFAMDPEIPDEKHIERHLRACVPKDTFKRLSRAGRFYVEP